MSSLVDKLDIDQENKTVGIIVAKKARNLRIRPGELYSALQEIFDDPDLMDEDLPIYVEDKYTFRVANDWTLTQELRAQILEEIHFVTERLLDE
jgi:hypothetical protein